MLYYVIHTKEKKGTQKLSDTGTTMVSSKLMFTLSFQETSGELYKAIVYEPSSYAAQTETEERGLVINAFNTTLQDFNLNNSSFVSDLDQDNLSFYFCVVKLVDTQHNATWWVVTIPIPSKTMRMEIDSNTRTVTTRISYETLGPDSDLLNASFLTIEEALAEPLSLAEKIFDGNYRTEEQKSWARQQRTHEEGAQVFENGINEGKLFSEIDAASQEALAKDVRQMQEIVREIHKEFGSF